MKIWIKLTVIVVVSLAAAVVTALVAADGFSRLEHLGRSLYERGIVDMALTSDLAVAFQEQRALVAKAPAELDLERLVADRSRVEALGRDMQDKLGRYGATATDDAVRARAARIEQALAAYRDAAMKVYDFAAVFAQEDAIKALQGPVADALKRADTEIVELSNGARAAAAATAESLPATAGRLLKTLGLVIVAVMVAAGGTAALVSRSITGPVSRLTDVVQVLATGDTSVEVPETGSRDEIGTMARAVEVFKRNAREVERLRTDREADERRAAAEKRAAMMRLADEVEHSVGAIAQSLSAASTELEASSQSLADTAEATSTQAMAVAAAAEQAATNVHAVAEADEKLGESIADIRKRVALSSRVSQQAAGKADHTNRLIGTLAESVQKIGEVVSLINDVAEQTNLLALNATIEAARAGEAGKGFAVVASEVKNLANQTGRATEEISSQIGAVQSATREAVAAIADIHDTIVGMSGTAHAIAESVDGQQAATAEILDSIQQAADGTRQVSAAVARVTEAAGETGSGAAQVHEASAELVIQGERLRAEMERFLAHIRAG